MARPKKDKTKAPKAEKKAPSASANGVGHNSSGLTDDQERALFFNHLGKIKRQKKAIASASGSLRQLYKTAKADGVPKKDIDYALGLEDGDETEQLLRRQREEQIARWLSHPIGMQADLFAGADRTPSADRAFDLGKIAGMKGESKHPPYDVSSEQGQRWMEGWQVGQEAIFDIQRVKDARAFEAKQADGEASEAASDEIDQFEGEPVGEPA